MISLKFRIAVFTFSPSAAESIKKAAKANVDDVDLELYDQGLEEAVPVAQALAEEGVEVIVSRRGTSALMRESLRIPIISFPVTSLDILTTIKQAAKHDRKILFPAFRKKIPGLEIVEDLMGIELLQYVYSDSKSLDEAFVRASEKGCPFDKFPHSFDLAIDFDMEIRKSIEIEARSQPAIEETEEETS